MSTSSISKNTHNLSTYLPLQQMTTQNEFIELSKTATKVRQEISKLSLTICDAESELTEAMRQKSLFISHYEIELSFTRRHYEDYLRQVPNNSALTVSYPEETLFDWEPQKLTPKVLEAIACTSEIVDISDDSENSTFVLDPFYSSLSEGSLRQCISYTRDQVTSNENERQARITKLAQIRFSTKDIYNKIRIYTPEKDRVIALGRQLSQMSNQIALLPEPTTAPQETRSFMHKLYDLFK